MKIKLIESQQNEFKTRKITPELFNSLVDDLLQKAQVYHAGKVVFFTKAEAELYAKVTKLFKARVKRIVEDVSKYLDKKIK